MRTGIREVWVRRPVLWGLTAYIAGLVLSVYFRIEPLYYWMTMTVALIFALVFRRRALFPVLLGLVLLFGCFRGALFYKAKNPLAPYIGKKITIQGTITGDPQIEPDRAIYILDVDAVLADKTVYPAKGKVRVGHYAGFSDASAPYPESAAPASAATDAGTLDPSSADSSDSYRQGSDSAVPERRILSETYQTGDLLQVSGTLKEPTGPRNPKGFDYKGYLARRGIYSMMNGSGRDIVFIRKGNPFSLGPVLAWFRKQADVSLDRSVGGRESALLKAMLLGQRWYIEPETEEAFNRTGLAHALSISGLHIGYIIVLLNFIFSHLHLQRWTVLILQTAILLLYCLLVGAAPPVIRSVVMAVVYFTGKALGRKADTVNSAGVAAFLI